MKTGFIIIGNNIIETLVAETEQEHQKGLMYIKPITPVMAFTYNYGNINKFWMKDTPSELDIVFCYKNKITQIHNGVPFSTAMIGDNTFSDLVVEFPKNSINKLGIKIGDYLELNH